MKTIRLPLFILVILSIGFLGYVQYSASQLPERVATHFGYNGTPDGWMSRDKHVLFFSAFGIGIPWFMVILGFTTKFFPNYLFNLPNRNYWLSPERKTQTCLYFCRYLIWMACITLLLFAEIQYEVVKANQNSPAKMPSGLFWPVLIFYIIAMLLLSIPTYFRFRKIPSTEDSIVI